MSDIRGFKGLRPFILLLLLLLFAAGCAANEPTPTPTIIALVTATAVPSTTPTASLTPQPVPPSATPTHTVMPTVTAVPTQTPIPLPLPPMTPFPTVTPNFVQYEIKPVFFSYGGYGGDGGSNTDVYYGRFTPSLIIYGDGQILVREGIYGESLTFLEATLTPAEMCILRQEIEATGFLEPHEEFFTQREGSEGAGVLGIQVENTVYSFYGPDVQYLVEDLANGVDLIKNYQPIKPLTPYSPTNLNLWVEEVTVDSQTFSLVWPSELPRIENLWVDRDQNIVLVEKEWVEPIYDLFSHQLSQKVFQEGENFYAIIARPVLPHETPHQIGYYPSAIDYVSLLNCYDEPSFISPTLPTVTPTLTAPAGRLTGKGRLLFITDGDGDDEIYVMEADGTNRLRLTNNLFDDSSPTWSPDGQSIVFVSNRDGESEIFVMAADGTNVVQITQNDTDDYGPSWSPDGSQIAFVSDRDNGWQQSEIYIMNSDGTQQRRLTNNTSRDLNPQWSADGRYIQFMQEVTFYEQYQLVTIDTEHPIEEKEQFFLQHDQLPVISPDGFVFATISWQQNGNRRDNWEIYLLNTNMDVTERFSVPVIFPQSLNWSNDGKFILFSGYGDYGRDIFALDVGTGEVIQLTFMQQDESDPALWP